MRRSQSLQNLSVINGAKPLSDLKDFKFFHLENKKYFEGFY